MATTAIQAKASVIPSLYYRDAPAAIDWLCEAFGFEKDLVIPGPDGTIAHAQLTFGGGMIMLGSAGCSDQIYSSKQPYELGGVVTQGIYIVVPDPDAICDRAKSAGAAIVIESEDKPYGGRGFTCRDLGGHLWSFGSYDPYREG